MSEQENKPVEVKSEQSSTPDELTVLKQTIEKTKPVLDTMQKWGLDAQSYAQNADAAFTVINDLIEKGVIDGHGRLVEKETQSTAPDMSNMFNEGQKVVSSPNDSIVAEVVNKALAPIMQKLKGLENDSSYLYHQRMMDKLSAQHGLTENEATKLMSHAARDRTKSLDEHARAFIASKNQTDLEMEKRFANKYGLDLEELEQVRRIKNKDTSPRDIVGGKKFSFRKRGDDFVTPGEAAKTYFKQVHSR